MRISPKGGAPALACATLAGVLMAGASTAALAAPKHKAARPAAARDAQIDELKRELEELKAQMADMRAQASTQQAATANTAQVQEQLAATQAQLADVKAAQASTTADIETLKAPPSGTTVIPSLPNGKPSFATADGRFTANIRAIVMFDMGKYFQKSNLPTSVVGRDLNSGTNFRRARFGIDGKLFKDFDYALIYEFGGSGAEDAGHIQEAWIQYTALKPWRIRIGAFEPNIGLAAAVSTSQMPILERATPAEIARNVAAGDSRSALQFTGNGVFGQGDSGIATRWFLSTAYTGNTVGTINSTGGSTAQPFEEQQGWIGRVALAPFSSNDWQAHIGFNAQYVFHTNDAGLGTNPRYPVQLRDRPELRLDATRLIDTGGIDARHVTVLGGEAGLTVKNFLLESEYFHFDIDRRLTAAQAGFSNPKFDGWYVQGAWVLTGEPRPYNPAEARFDGPKMNYNFNPSAGTWGAVELVARYSDMDLNYHSGGAGVAQLADAIRGGEQKVTTAGVNWYLNPSIRLMLDYQHVDIDRLNAAGAQVGQTYDALAGRVQWTF
jgi:phosphate-selective porin OprO/OprP